MNHYKIKIFFAVFTIIIFSMLFFFAPDIMTDGIRNGLTVCGTSVIPSLFPFIVISDFVLRSGLGDVVGKRLSPLTERIFRLPGDAACAVLLGLVGGFPIGASMAARLYENGRITQKQGRRMILFCVNAGPAFVIGAVGSSMMSNRKAGIILFASLTLTSVFLGFLSGRFAERTNVKIKSKPHFDGSVFIGSVSASVNTMLGVCAWILLFSGLNAYLMRLPVSENIAAALSVLTEVTGGCMSAAKLFPPFVCAFAVGWSGLAVHCQLLPYLKTLNMKIHIFWLSRLITGAVSAAVAFAGFKLFPCEVEVFASSSELMTKPFSVSAPAAAAVLILSAVTLIDNPCVKATPNNSRLKP